MKKIKLALPIAVVIALILGVYVREKRKCVPWAYRVNNYIYRYLKDMGVKSGYVEVGGDGMVNLDLENSEIEDVSILDGLPISKLNISRTRVKDITFLRDFKGLTELRMSKTAVSDLTPIKKLPIRDLRISNTVINDLSPIKNMPLRYLAVVNTPVTNIEIIAEMQIKDIMFSPSLYSEEQLHKLRKVKFNTINMQGDNDAFWKDFSASRLKLNRETVEDSL